MAGTAPPDPSKGVFETMLVVDGRPVELDAHLARLMASLKTLFGAGPPIGIRERLRDRAGGLPLGRLRLTVAPHEGGGLGLEVSATAIERAAIFPAWERGAVLGTIGIEGGLGPHKWADRASLERAQASLDGALPLLLDRDGTVLEASRANVFAISGAVLTTPPADGRILPGVARARTIEIAGAIGIDVREQTVALTDLFDADGIFLTGSVRGIEPVRRLLEVELAGGDVVLARLAAELRRRWLGASPFGGR